MVSGSLSMGLGDTGAATIDRGGTNLAAGNAGFFTAVSNNNYCISMMAYDAPSTTSSVTYTAKIRTNGAAASIKFPVNVAGPGTGEATMILVEIAQ